MLHEIDLSRADLNLLVLFETLLRERHVGRAAQRLNLSASAVSHALRRLRRLLNDPLFLRTPRGVVPTARALELAGSLDDVLAGIRRVIATAAPFDPLTSAREYTIGAPDGASSVFLRPLLSRLRHDAPRVNLRLRQLLPNEGARTAPSPWEGVFKALDDRAIDLAVGPFEPVPARFLAQKLCDEDFVVVSRAGHPYTTAPGLEAYCTAGHIVVSQTGNAYGFVDRELEKLGLSRRVALTVPGFFMALTVTAETDLLAAVPRSFASAHGAALGLAITEAPLSLPHFEIRSVLPRVALADAGLAWLNSVLASTHT